MSAWIRQKKSGDALLKLGFAKAYDMLDWDFILEVLYTRGFGCRWIK